MLFKRLWNALAVVDNVHFDDNLMLSRAYGEKAFNSCDKGQLRDDYFVEALHRVSCDIEEDLNK